MVSSLRQGVFVFKRKNVSTAPSPKKKVRRKSSKPNAETETSSAFEHFGTEKKGLEEFRSDRFRIYESLRENISKTMADQQKQNFGKVLADVEIFVRFVSSFRLF